MSYALSAHAAAARLGVSDRTVRRWIASGRLKADKAAGEFQITLEDLDTLTGHAAAAAAAPGHEPDNAAAPATEGSRLDAAPAAALSADLSGLIAMIERQQEQLLERTEAAAMWQARAMMLEERMKALEAPKPVPEFVPPAVHDPQPALDPFPFPVPNPPTPNRWRRWWLAVMGGGLVLMVGASCQQPTRSTVSAPHLCRAAQFSLARVEQELAPQANPVLGGTLMGTWTGVNELVTVIERLCRP